MRGIIVAFIATVTLAVVAWGQDTNGVASTIVTNCCGDAQLVIQMDKDQRPIDHSVFNKDGSLRERTVFEHDANGRTTKTTLYDGSGKRKRTDTFQYDARGEVVSVRRLDAQGKQTVREQLFDEQGRPIGTKYKDVTGKEISPAEWQSE